MHLSLVGLSVGRQNYISLIMGTENKNDLYVCIGVKPYCYRYLCKNYGLKGAREGYISLRHSRLLHTALCSLLQHKTFLDIGRPPSDRFRTKEVYVYVEPHYRKKYGIDLTEKGKDVWAMLVEQICQEDFKQFFFNVYMAEPRTFKIIELYKELRGYTEGDWPSESMKKIVVRMNVNGKLNQKRKDFLNIFRNFYHETVPSSGLGKNIKTISKLCNLTLTTGEASEEFMPSQQ